MIPNTEGSDPSAKTPSPEGSKNAKIDKRNFMFINISDKELVKLPGEVNGNPFKVSYLVGCTVWVMDHCANFYADESENCKLNIGPVAGNAQLQDLTDCTISVACKTLKIANCQKYF